MASLGKLWFELGMRDRTDKDIAEIRKGIEKRLKELNVDIGLNGEALRRSIEDALAGRQFKVGILVDKASATKAVQDALARAGYTASVRPDDVRAARIEEINKRIANSYEESQAKVKKLQAQIDRLRSTHERASSSASKYSGSLGGVTKNMRTQFNLAVQLRNQLANIYSVYAAERFLTSVIEIGGEFQKQRVALQTMFQDAQKADVLFGQIKELAVESPFEFKELAGYTKQLAAFNIPYEEMYDTTKRLADISAGVGVDMGRIILAYGQVRSAEFLKGTELRQFTEAGIPLLRQLADKFTELEGRVVSVGEVFDRISTRQVSFQMVKDVLWDLTSEGGQFYNMQGALADTLAGKLSNLRDAYDVMLADIAQSNEGLLGSGLDLLTDTMNHWEELSGVILSAAAAYGTYKAALVVLNAYKSVQMSSVLLNRTQAMLNALRATQGLTSATKAQIIAQRGLNAVMKANPIVLVASALAALVGSYMLFSDKVKSTDEMITGLNESVGHLKKSFEDLSNTDKMIDEYEELSNKQSKTTEESRKLDTITNTLYERFGGAAEKADEYGKAIGLSAEKMRELNKQQKENIIAGVNVELKEAEDRADKVRAQIDELTNEISKGANVNATSMGQWGTYISGYTQKDIDNFKKQRKDYQNELNRLEDSAKKTREFLKGLGEAGEDANLENALSGWRKAVADFIAGNRELKDLTPKDTEEYVDWYKRLSDALSEAKSDLDKMKGTVGLFDDDTVRKQQEYVNALEGIVRRFNINISEGDGEKGKDPIAERFERQLDLMKSAMDTYNKYVALVGKEDAVRKVNEDTRFASLDFNPDTYVDDLNKLLDAASQEITRSDSLTKARDSIQKAITDFNMSEVKVNTEKLLEGMRETIEENTSRWNLYEELFKTSGDREMSLRFAFGVDASSLGDIYSQSDLLKKELLSITGKTYEELENLSEQGLRNLLGGLSDTASSLIGSIKDSLKNESDDIIRDVVNLVHEYAAATDKIKAIESQRDEKLRRLRASDSYGKMTIGERATSEGAIMREYENQSFDQFVNGELALAFENVERLGNGTIDRLISKLEEYKEKAIDSLDPENLETYMDALNRLKDASIDRKLGWTELFGGIPEILKTRIKLQAEYNNAEEIANELTQKRINLENELESVSKGLTDYVRGLTGETVDLNNANVDYIETLIRRKGEEQGLGKDQIERNVSAFMSGSQNMQGIISQLGNVTSAANQAGVSFGKAGEALGSISGGAGGAASSLAVVDMIIKGVDQSVQATNQMVQDLVNTLDALGKDTAIDTGIGKFAEFWSVFAESSSHAAQGWENLKSGNMAGAVAESASAIMSVVRGIAQFHDKKLQRAIEESQMEVEKLQMAYENLEMVIERQLGGVIEEQSDAMINNLIKQREEIEKQMRAEDEKKKTDESKMNDYSQQIAELDDQIEYFYEDLAKDLYGIDIKDWASQFSDSLIDAWRRGEDAAEAFSRTASDVLADVASEMISLAILEPALEKLRNKIPTLMEDGSLNNADMSVIADELLNIEKAYNEGLLTLEELEALIQERSGGRLSLKDMEDTSSSGDTLSAGIQGVTEDTANLLGSYLNAIRQDVSVIRHLQESLGGNLLPTISVTAQAQLQQLNAIAENTRLNAEYAKRIDNFLNGTLSGVITNGNGGRAIRIK